MLLVRTLLLSLVIAAMAGCMSNQKTTDEKEKSISALLDSFNEAAARADFDTYFNFYADDAVFIGTDASEHWDKNSFMEYARPHFERGRAWSFKAIERNIYLNESGEFAWFDELLSTQMKICRGSGVLLLTGDEWKIKQYVLSMTIPNDVSAEVIEIKSVIEEDIIQKLSGN